MTNINTIFKTTVPGNTVYEIHLQHALTGINNWGGYSIRYIEVPDTETGKNEAIFAAFEDMAKDLNSIEMDDDSIRVTLVSKIEGGWEYLLKHRKIGQPRGPKQHTPKQPVIATERRSNEMENALAVLAELQGDLE